MGLYFGVSSHQIVTAQQRTQNSFNETKFKEIESFLEQTKQTTERILENQLKPSKDKHTLETNLVKIGNTLTIAQQESIKVINAHQESIKVVMASAAEKQEETNKSIKTIEDAMASNEEKEKERIKKDKLKDQETLKYFHQLNERITNMETAIQSKQADQAHIEAIIPPTQSNTVVSQDFIAVQKTENK